MLDGRNRLRACALAGVAPRFEDWRPDGTSPTAWVIATNLHRRHLDVGQRAAIAVALLPLLEAEARERQGGAGRFGSASIDAEPEMPTVAGKAAAVAAGRLGVSPASVERAKYLKLHHPEVRVQSDAKGYRSGAGAE